MHDAEHVSGFPMTGERRAPELARGVYAALVTPRRPSSLEVDTSALLEYLDVIARAQVSGVVLFGATGEFVHFGIEERARAAAMAVKRSKIPVLVNVSHSTLEGAVEIAASALEAGASGVLLSPPYFYTYPDNQIFEFYRQFVDSMPGELPVYLYNLPMFLNPISAGLGRRLMESGRFAGVKDSSDDLGLLEPLTELRPKVAFQFLVGNETNYLRGRLQGAEGVVSGIAAALPELMAALDRSILASDKNRAQQLNGRLLEFLDRVKRFPATVAIRESAVARGWMLSHMAIPLDEDTAANLIVFHSWFLEWLPQVLAECSQPAAVRT